MLLGFTSRCLLFSSSTHVSHFLELLRCQCGGAANMRHALFPALATRHCKQFGVFEGAIVIPIFFWLSKNGLPVTVDVALEVGFTDIAKHDFKLGQF